ncbi:tetratricopeptide repeat protein [Roseimaritima sediminicola]|uniref:tetratricopeptide repeat protein n=1 Tax=Roseimaritima sediminicola TaxID=2662066 RepID=UPI0012984D25|nr:hypothetical protein [Roseimaritima sediminicola]
MDGPYSRLRVWLSGLGLVLGVLLVFAAILSLRSGSGAAVRLFGRLDVVACALFAVLPSALRLVARAATIPAALRALLVLVCAVVAWVVYQGVLFQIEAGIASRATWPWIVVVAWFSMAAVGLAAVWRTLLLTGSGDRRWGWDVAFLVMAFCLPALYVDSVSTGLKTQLNRSLQDQRILRGLGQAEQLMQLQPHWEVHGVPLARLKTDLEEATGQLLAEARRPLSPAAPTGQRGGRVAVLLQLERPEEALRVLQPLLDGEHFHPIALDYQGLCYQRMEQYPESLEAYQASADYWKDQPEQPQQVAGLSSALKGIAFASRQLGMKRAEEQAYSELVQRYPTGPHHMLLAKCYQEHQKGALAAKHAKLAKAQDPQLAAQADKMLASMAVHDFGCFQVQ